MALTALQQLQNESALIQQGKIGEAVASSQSYVAAQPKVTPVVTPTSPVPVAPVISTPAVVAKPVVSTPTISPAVTPAPVAKPVAVTPAVVTPKYVTRNLSAEQKALSDILASSNIKDGTDVTTLSAATQKLLQENINNAVYGTGSPLFYGTPPPTVAPTVAPTAPAIAPAINRPVLDALIPTTPIEPTSPYFTALPEAPQSLQEVRDEQLGLAQASVDATEAYFQASLARINAIGASNLAQTSSIAVGAGLAGSPFQQALEQSTVGATTTALGEVSAQRSVEVSNFLAQAENNAQNIYQQGVINYKNDLSFYANERDKEIAYEEAHAEAIKESGLETINNIAKSGYSLDEMPKDQYESLLANTGLSDFEARVVWSANTPEANATYTTQGNYLVQTYFDPQTKKPVVTAIPLPVELQTFETEGIDVQQIQLADGSVILYDSKHPMDENGNLRTIDYAGGDIRDVPKGGRLGSSAGTGGVYGETGVVDEVGQRVFSTKEKESFAKIEAVKDLDNGRALREALIKYYSYIEDFGGALISPTQKKSLKSLYGTVTGALKNAETLGTLDAGLMTYVKERIPAPDKLMGASRLVASAKSHVSVIKDIVSGLDADAKVKYDDVLSQYPEYESYDYLNQLMTGYGYHSE